MAAFYSATVLGLSVYLILWLFLVYSFVGVLIEGTFCLLVNGVLELRLGLLYLPLRPLYGFGGVACTLFLQRLLHEPIMVFLLGMLICTVVEFEDSWVAERGFGALSWDYSDKLLNVQGRVCLQYSFCWGVLALVLRIWGRLVDRLVPDRVIIASFPRMSLVRELEELTDGRPRTEVHPDNGHDGAIALRAQKPSL